MLGNTWLIGYIISIDEYTLSLSQDAYYSRCGVPSEDTEVCLVKSQ